VLAVGGYAATFAYDLWSTDARIREEREAEARIDLERDPFSGSITYDTSLPEDFKIVLDRPLTAQEAAVLEATPTEEVWNYLEPLGGRLIRRFSGPIAEPPIGWSWEDGPEWPEATVFTMTLLSARTSQLSIVDMDPVNVSCAEPTGVTVVDYPPAGQAAYPGVVVDLQHDDPTLFISDEGPDQGEPYFSRRRIDVGGGLEPGGLRVEAAVLDQSCEWEIEARYRDAQQNAGQIILDDGGRPFLAEASPARPDQYWLASYAVGDLTEERTFVPCHEMPDTYACAFSLGETTE